MRQGDITAAMDQAIAAAKVEGNIVKVPYKEWERLVFAVIEATPLPPKPKP